MTSIIVTHENERYDLSFDEKPTPTLKKGECLIKLKAAALNRRDYWISVGRYPGIKPGVTLGSDGCGVVVSGDPRWQGRTVLINPNNDWGLNPDAQSSAYNILGMPGDGTFAEYVSVPTHRLIEKPAHLSDIDAAAIPLAGLTAFRAIITKGNIQPRDKVLVTGIGGGVSQFALAFALTQGAEVYVNSSSDKKIQKAVEVGAKAGFDYTDAQWVKQAGTEVGKFDVIVDSAGGDAINDYLKLVRPGGRIVVYGSTTGRPNDLDLFRLFWSQVSIVGSTMGNDLEFEQMIRYVDQHRIQPVIDSVYPFSEGVSAIKAMGKASHLGKTLLQISD